MRDVVRRGRGGRGCGGGGSEQPLPIGNKQSTEHDKTPNMAVHIHKLVHYKTGSD